MVIWKDKNFIYKSHWCAKMPDPNRLCKWAIMADYHTSFCQNFPIFLKLQAMETIGRENDHLSQSNFKYCQCKWTLMTLVRIPRRIITIFGVENFGKNKSWFFFHLPNFLSLINWMSIIQNFSRKVLIIKTVDVLGGENQGWLAFFQTPKNENLKLNFEKNAF